MKSSVLNSAKYKLHKVQIKLYCFVKFEHLQNCFYFKSLKLTIDIKYGLRKYFLRTVYELITCEKRG